MLWGGYSRNVNGTSSGLGSWCSVCDIWPMLSAVTLGEDLHLGPNKARGCYVTWIVGLKLTPSCHSFFLLPLHHHSVQPGESPWREAVGPEENVTNKG